MRQTVYEPDSVTWRVNQEAVLLLGGGRALLMQLAHPGVAAGVAEHSSFQREPLRRLQRTLELTLTLTFGSRTEALAAARRINLVHQRVRGPGYSAGDPRLLLWVHATLIDSALVTYRTFVGALSRPDEEAYYREAKLVGGLLGVSNGQYPAGLDDFDAYVGGMLAGGLTVDARARELAGLVLRPRLRGMPRAVFRLLAAVTAGLLPDRLRADYGLPWGRPDRAAFATARRALPALVAVLPSRFRLLPPARRARAGTLWDLNNRSS